MVERGHFYPRSPCGERPRKCQSSRAGIGISIHALLAESDQAANGLANAPPQISIHALLAESDLALLEEFEYEEKISIHALLAESDFQAPNLARYSVLFLSTLSLRRATSSSVRLCRFNSYFYPRSPCGERPQNAPFSQNFPLISIHALLAESDHNTYRNKQDADKFLSTLSLRRATPLAALSEKQQRFLSTLSLRRATLQSVPTALRTSDFYPRSPCGERLALRVGACGA